MPLIRERLSNLNISRQASELIMQSWRKSSQKQYKVYIKKWITFAAYNNIHSSNPCVKDILEFLTTLHAGGSSYSAISTARSALSAVLTLNDGNISIGEHPLVGRLLKAVYHTRPPKPRYVSTWNVTDVLSYLKEWSPPSLLDLRKLTLKLVMLCVLVSGQRCQTMQMLNLENMTRDKSSFRFTITKLIKQSRPGTKQPFLVFTSFPSDPRLCVFSYTEEYIRRTHFLRTQGNTQLFISFACPYKPVHTSTTSRWIKTVMQEAGIDIDSYKAHSTRAASTSAALQNGVPMDTILQTAGWSSEATLARYYNKEILDKQSTFAVSLLST